MNLIPLNKLCEPLVGDVVTLPNISSFGSFLLEDGEMALISSEDVRCFSICSGFPAPGNVSSGLIGLYLHSWFLKNGVIVPACSLRACCLWDFLTACLSHSTSTGT